MLPRDLLPTSPVKPSFYVVNQDESSEAGSHWIVVFMQDNKITEYFDPLGKVPDQHLKDYMSFQSRSYLYNRKRKIISQTCVGNIVCFTVTSEPESTLCKTYWTCLMKTT